MKAQVDMSSSQNQYQPAQVGAPKGDSDDAYWADPYCAADTDGVSGEENKNILDEAFIDKSTKGIWKWRNLRSEGVLLDDWTKTGPGWQRYWDDVTKTPWLFNPETKIYISYDDPQSLSVKVNHALCENLGGLMVW